MPKAFLIAELTVTDQATYETYRSQVLSTIESIGGRFVVRGGKRLQVEGVDEGHHNMLRTVVVEFPSMDIATAWYDNADASVTIDIIAVADRFVLGADCRTTYLT